MLLHRFVDDHRRRAAAHADFQYRAIRLYRLKLVCDETELRNRLVKFHDRQHKAPHGRAEVDSFCKSEKKSSPSHVPRFDRHLQLGLNVCPSTLRMSPHKQWRILTISLVSPPPII